MSRTLDKSLSLNDSNSQETWSDQERDSAEELSRSFRSSWEVEDNAWDPALLHTDALKAPGIPAEAEAFAKQGDGAPASKRKGKKKKGRSKGKSKSKSTAKAKNNNPETASAASPSANNNPEPEAKAAPSNPAARSTPQSTSETPRPARSSDPVPAVQAEDDYALPTGGGNRGMLIGGALVALIAVGAAFGLSGGDDAALGAPPAAPQVASQGADEAAAAAPETSESAVTAGADPTDEPEAAPPGAAEAAAAPTEAEALEAAPTEAEALAAAPAVEPEPEVATVRIRLRTVPHRAQLKIDGQPVPNPYDGQHPMGSRAHRIEASSDGYESQELQLAFAADVQETLRLERAPEPEPVAAPAPMRPAPMRPVATAMRPAPMRPARPAAMRPAPMRPAAMRPAPMRSTMSSGFATDNPY